MYVYGFTSKISQTWLTLQYRKVWGKRAVTQGTQENDEKRGMQNINTTFFMKEMIRIVFITILLELRLNVWGTKIANIKNIIITEITCMMENGENSMLKLY